MRSLELILTANAGFIAVSGGRSVLIDALHDEKAPPFDTLSPELTERVFDIMKAAPPLAVIATHRHPDHYSERLVRRALTLWPDCELLAPEDFDAENSSLSLPGLEVSAVRTKHDGERFSGVEHMCCRVTLGGFTVLAPGDTSPWERESLLPLVSGRRIDAALLNFPWVTLRAPREFVQNELRPRCAVIAHLPREADDAFGYRAAARAGAAQLRGIRAVVMDEPLQRLTLTEP